MIMFDFFLLLLAPPIILNEDGSFSIFAKVGCRDVCTYVCVLYKIYTYMYNTVHYKPLEWFPVPCLAFTMLIMLP